MNQLFREEVLKNQKERHLGDVLLAAPIRFWAITCLLILILTGLFIFILFGEYARKERVPGVLSPNKGLVEIIPSRAGNFSEIYVKQGDSIKEGDPLFKTLDNTATYEGKIILDELVKSFEIEKNNLTVQLDNASERHVLSLARLNQKKEKIIEESERLEERISVQEDVLDLEKEVFMRMRELRDKDMISFLEFSRQKTRLLEAKRDLSAIKNNYKKLLAEIGDIDIQLLLLPLDKVKVESDIEAQISELNQTIVTTTSISSSIVRSPVDGTVASLTVKEGEISSSRVPALTIIPVGSVLQAELFVPPRSAGFIEVGQNIKLLYDAFPYQKFGFYKGNIVKISKVVVDAEKRMSSKVLPEPVFFVTVSVHDQFIEFNEDKIPLQSGMTLFADIVLEERKIWEWLLKPFLPGVNK